MNGREFTFFSTLVFDSRSKFTYLTDAKAMLKKEMRKIYNQRECPTKQKKSFPNTSPASYDIATRENAYANSVMQAPFSSGKCVEID